MSNPSASTRTFAAVVSSGGAAAPVATTPVATASSGAVTVSTTAPVAAVTQKSYKAVASSVATRVATRVATAAPVATAARVATAAPVATASSSAIQRCGGAAGSNAPRSNPMTGREKIDYIRMFAIQVPLSTFSEFFKSLIEESVFRNLCQTVQEELPGYIEEAIQLNATKSNSTQRIELPKINEG